MNYIFGQKIDEILRINLGLTNVDLIGKCASAGVVIQTVLFSEIYNTIYLAVPSIVCFGKSLKNKHNLTVKLFFNMQDYALDENFEKLQERIILIENNISQLCLYTFKFDGNERCMFWLCQNTNLLL
jgi:hypothetical protein